VHILNSCNEQAHQRYDYQKLYTADRKSYLNVAKPFQSFPTNPGEDWTWTREELKVMLCFHGLFHFQLNLEKIGATQGKK
jgi:hypothetical protein